ncbi:MAG: hypothetical protein WCP85_09945 [Mariniphaga sp.]
MSINFFEAKCRYITAKKLFGLCDDSTHTKNKTLKQAYLDEENGAKWIAVVDNSYNQRVTFSAIDNCIEIKSEKGKMLKRCDGVLTFDETVAFVELKERVEKKPRWIKDAEMQLRSTIGYFEKSEDAQDYKTKKAYIANNQRPKFRESQIDRMDQFLTDTGYVLRIENRIIIE